MANESTEERAAHANRRAGSAGTTKGRLAAMWRAEWQLIGLSWFAGISIGSVLLWAAYNLPPGADALPALTGGIFMIVVPGTYSTWRTWQDYRKRQQP